MPPQLTGVAKLLASLGHWKKSYLGPHIKYITTRDHTQKSHNVLSKYVILCWAAFIAILGHRLDAPVRMFSLSITRSTLLPWRVLSNASLCKVPPWSPAWLSSSLPASFYSPPQKGCLTLTLPPSSPAVETVVSCPSVCLCVSLPLLPLFCFTLICFLPRAFHLQTHNT